MADEKQEPLEEEKEKDESWFDQLTDLRALSHIKWLVQADKEDPQPSRPVHKHGFSKPVAWLLGRQLLSAVKWMLLFAAFQGRLDIRDWMKTEVIAFPEPAEGDEFWFDYFADSGDGQMAMYSLAYLFMSDLWAEGSADTPPPVNSELGFESSAQRKYLLPRGEFLVDAGDASYHIADYSTLAYRFQLPFIWAYRDLVKGGKLAGEGRRRPVFGVPGNHDYYDELDGFNRQFREPASYEETQTKTTPNRPGSKPQLSLPSFERRQHASYIALQLPFGWWLWGLDVWLGKLDIRQQEFFKRLNNHQPPDKLIVTTHNSTTVMGRRAQETDELAMVFEDLGLEQTFLENGPKIPEGRCRLDLSGHTHYYARYWGPKAEDAAPEAPSENNYASVVAGLGGASLSSWQPSLKEIKEQVLYPNQRLSLIEVTKRILNPFNIMSGGNIWLLGLVITMALYFAAIIAPNSKQVIDGLLLKRIGITQDETLRLNVQRSPFNVNVERQNIPFPAQPNYQPFWHSCIIFLSLLVLVASILLNLWYSKHLDKKTRKRLITTWDYWPNWVFTAIGIATPIAAIWVFGTNEASRVLSDVIFLVVLMIATFGLIAVAVVVGGAFQRTWGKIGFGFLGLWHAILQVATPFLLLRVGNIWVLFAEFAIIFFFIPFGIWLVRRNASRWVLLVTWLIYGALALFLPIKFSDATARLPVGWMAVLFFLLAAVVGALVICVWFGWYLL
ncbi:MAG TPA: metallophosphoesterase, partial [Pyrinomonadaceae bacterium]